MIWPHAWLAKRTRLLYRDNERVVHRTDHSRKYHNLYTIMLFVCRPKVLHRHCLQFLLGVKMAPKGNWKQCLCKNLGWQTKSIMVCYGISRVRSTSRKAPDNIDLNQMSHRYVSGDLQNDWNDPVDFRSLDRSQRRCYIWVSLSYKTVNTVVSSLYH